MSEVMTESASHEDELPTPSGAPPREPPVASTFRRLRARLLISLVLAALFVFVIERGGVPLIPSSDAFASVRW